MLLGASGLASLASVIQVIVVARMLGVEEFGVYALVTAVTATVAGVVDSRSWEAAIQFVTRYLERGDSQRSKAVIKLCYVVDAVTGLAAFFALVALAELASRLLVKDASAASFIRIFAFSLVLSIPLGTSSAILRIGNQFSAIAFHSAGLAGLRLIGALGTWAAGGGLQVLLWTQVFAIGIGALAMLAMSRTVTKQHNLTGWTAAQIRDLKGDFGEIGRFLGATNLGALLKLIQRRLDVLLTGYYLSPTAVGYLHLARQITNLMVLPVTPMTTASYPEFARLWHANRAEELRALVRRLSMMSAGIAMVTLLGVWALSPVVIRMTVGLEYLPAVPVLYWFAAGVALAVATTFAHPLLLATGRAASSTVAIAIGATGQAVALTLLLPAYGVVAAGIAYVTFYLLWFGWISLSSRMILTPAAA